jgi:hypothetical protein
MRSSQQGSEPSQCHWNAQTYFVLEVGFYFSAQSALFSLYLAQLALPGHCMGVFLLLNSLLIFGLQKAAL